jgi:hypothetical protein
MEPVVAPGLEVYGRKLWRSDLAAKPDKTAQHIWLAEQQQCGCHRHAQAPEQSLRPAPQKSIIAFVLILEWLLAVIHF